jgi:asparagine synthase (glutamine-hydrolysing)
MCGINGFYSRSLSMYNDVIFKMNSAISHRGPDSNGVWLDKSAGIVFGHQRLSIIDLSKAGNQPMLSNSGRYILTYNGEIYNHLKIIEELEKSNYSIKWLGRSDTETLIQAIEFWGIKDTLKKIEGMFAFGLWDKKKRSLTLARDRIGEKPLYFGWQGEGINQVFLFSSELKALKVHPEFKGIINRDAISLQLRHCCIPAPFSIYKDINKLLPGHFLELEERDLKEGLLPSSIPYWSLLDNAKYGNNNQLKQSEIEIQNELEDHLKSSVRKQMISDVPFGAFLSGGIDSSTISALMQAQSTNPIKTFTIGFNENEFNEAQFSKKIAAHLGTEHTELYVSSKQAMEVIPKLPDIYDEPFSDPSQLPTFLVSQIAKKHVKVALSGDGGDELFCGYNRYVMSKKFSILYSLLPLSLRKIIGFSLKSISSKNLDYLSKFLPNAYQYPEFGNKVYKGANALKAETIHDLYCILGSNWKNPTEIAINSKETSTLLNKLKFQLGELDNQQQMMVLDFMTYLPDDILVKVDRASMASSLETRVPFLDHKLIEYVWRIPQSLKLRNGSGKWILKKILNKYVPNELTERPKMGFGIPIESWLRGPLKDWAENLLDEKRLQEEGYFNSKLIREKWTEHLGGKKNCHNQLWDVLMFQAWKEKNN